MTREEIEYKLDVFKNRSEENVVHCSKSILKSLTYIDNHYGEVVSAAKAIGEKFNKLANCLAYCRILHMNIASLLQSTIVIYDSIRYTIENYVKSNRFQKDFELEAACVFLDNVCNLIWRFESCLMELTRLDPDTDFRKRKNFKTIMERINGEASNFIDIEKVVEKMHDFEKNTEYVYDYMATVFNDKTYIIKDDYINVFDAITRNVEYMHNVFIHRFWSMISEVKLQYFGKDAYMDPFAFFVTNSIFNDLCFTVFIEFEGLFNSAKYIMPKNA